MKQVGDLLELPRAAGRQPQPPQGSSAPSGKGDDVCPICKGKGFLARDLPLGHPDFGEIVPCRCTQARLVAERMHDLREVSNLGALERMTFDAFRPDGIGLSEMLRFNLREAYELSLAYAKDPKGWLVLAGGYGCGKTHLAAAIANYRIALGHPVLFVVVPDLLDHLRAAFAPESNAALDERLDAVRDAPLLILDDLGAQNSTPWAQEKLFQILNHRYNGRMPTVITSNQRLEDLDPRITSRLVDPDLSQVYGIAAPDFRQPEGERGVGQLSTLSWHRDQTFESFTLRTAELPAGERDNLRRAVALARDFAETPSGWLVLTGTFGSGKTHLAAAIANRQAAKTGIVPMFVVVPDLLDHLRATFSPSSAITLDRLFEQVKSAPLLVLDDLGTESATPWAKEKLFQLLNYRYAARLPTVITTSTKTDLIEPRLLSRMLDSARCTVFVIEAPSYRGSKAQREAHGTRRIRSQKTDATRSPL